MSAGGWALAILALCAFAANSLLARAALAHTAIDAGSFTLLRLASGAAVLAAIVAWRGALPWRVNRPGFDGHLHAVHYGIHGGGYGWQEVHDRVQG